MGVAFACSFSSIHVLRLVGKYQALPSLPEKNGLTNRFLRYSSTEEDLISSASLLIDASESKMSYVTDETRSRS